MWITSKKLLRTRFSALLASDEVSGIVLAKQFWLHAAAVALHLQTGDGQQHTHYSDRDTAIYAHSNLAHQVLLNSAVPSASPI
jgi:hypothetical protein